MTFQGPTPEFWERYSRATNAPAIMNLGLDGVDALNQRVVVAREFANMSREDQQLIEQAEYEISAGLSPTLQHPEDWAAGSDWAAEDAAILGDTPTGEAKSGGVGEDDPVTHFDFDADVDLATADLDSWVGL